MDDFDDIKDDIDDESVNLACALCGRLRLTIPLFFLIKFRFSRILR